MEYQGGNYSWPQQNVGTDTWQFQSAPQAGLKAHEVLECQELARGAAAAVHTCRQMAQLCQDPELAQFLEQEAQSSQQTAQRLISLISGGSQQFGTQF